MYGKIISEADARQMGGLTLAYIGDTVFENFVRECVVFDNVRKTVFELHKETVKTVNCRAQSAILKKLIDDGMLSENELYIVKRGKNCKSHSVPKNADRETYMEATGFEALIGYLYVTGSERLNALFAEIRKEIK